MKVIIILQLMAKIAWFMAKVGANSASVCNNYQPPLPSQLAAK